jgi:hypothetical protein
MPGHEASIQEKRQRGGSGGKIGLMIPSFDGPLRETCVVNYLPWRLWFALANSAAGS